MFSIFKNCPLCNCYQLFFLYWGEDSFATTKFLIIGAGRRRTMCKKCGSSDRERLVYLYLRDELKVFGAKKNIKALHFAPEKNLSEKLSKEDTVGYIKGDWLEGGYDYDKTVKKIDVCNIPYENNVFDLIVCNHVLEHIEDDRKAMSELYRVLKPGGKAILQVPISNLLDKTLEDFSIIDPQERLKTFGQEDHVRVYGKDYVERLEEVGFKVQIKNFSNEKKYKRFGLNPDENLFLGEK